MGKMTTFSGQPQYLQILNLANRSKILRPMGMFLYFYTNCLVYAYWVVGYK